MSSETADTSDDDLVSRTVCHLCRQRKTKCDRKLPKCSFCVKAKVDCRYVTQPKKRGLRAGYVAELEERLDKLEHEVDKLRHPGGSPNAAPSQPISSQIQMPPILDVQNQKSAAEAIGFDQPGRGLVGNSAMGDMMSLPQSLFHQMAESWFKETQMWWPILNHDHIQRSLEALPTPVDHINDVELRAVMALQISYSTLAICLGYSGRGRLSKYLRSQVLEEAMANPSMSSLRALLIIALLDYGSDNISSTFGLLAVCRRMCEHIGLFRQLLKRIEDESPAQVGPPAVAITSGEDVDGMAVPLTWCILGLDAVSSLGVSWRDVSAALVDHLSSIAFISTPDFRDSFRTHAHLAAIGLQPVHEFFSAQARHANVMDSPLETCEEIYRNLMTYVDGLPETSYRLLPDGAIDFDINQIFTHVLSHGAIIMIYQRFVFNQDEDTTALARQRCLESCGMIIQAMRSISDADAEVTNSPLVASFLFVAARLKLVLYKMLAQPREPLFDILMHSINMLGRRWQYARRIDIVLRAAICEVDTGSPTPLPAEFWELTKSHLDVSETLKSWVNQHVPSLYVGMLDGPYT